MTKPINEILKARREELSLTLEDVASKVGVNSSTVSRWESGNINNMRRDRIAKLSEVLQISPSVIMGWTEKKPDYIVGRDEKIEAVVEMMYKVPESRRETMLNYVKAIVEAEKNRGETNE